MKRTSRRCLSFLCAALAFSGASAAEPAPALPPAAAVPVAPEPLARPMRDPRVRKPIALNPDDVPAVAAPPAGFDVAREEVPHGRIEVVEYDSTTTGTRRKLSVYTPPGYAPDRKYPVVYALHGIGGDHTEWPTHVTPGVLLDNLIAAGQAVPMIVVMPNGRAAADDRPPKNFFDPAHFAAFASFERDLLDDIIPFIEAKYATFTDTGHRALCGLSMGGGQTMNIGLGHPDRFAWIGAFTPGPNTRPRATLVPDRAAFDRNVRLLWLSCGNRDQLLDVPQAIHADLQALGVPHVWHVDGNAHDTPEWRANFFHFAQRIFR